MHYYSVFKDRRPEGKHQSYRARVQMSIRNAIEQEILRGPEAFVTDA